MSAQKRSKKKGERGVRVKVKKLKTQSRMASHKEPSQNKDCVDSITLNEFKQLLDVIAIKGINPPKRSNLGLKFEI
ncbi:hypothetical protein CEB3_c05360 [Peptococcaceae bacterium CEB3]|nr:hypothetical protein CEB3_c05360 [Peptococcaceae bacterium CEB3]